VIIAYDILLCALVVLYAIRQLRSFPWSIPTQGLTSLTWIIVQGNLAHFFIALSCIILSSLYGIITLNMQNQIPFQFLYQISELVLSAMTGPRMIISLRKSYSIALESGTAGTNEITTVVFASAPQQSQSEQTTSLPA